MKVYSYSLILFSCFSIVISTQADQIFSPFFSKELSVCQMQNGIFFIYFFSKTMELQLIHCILVDSSTVISWTSPFAILRVSGLFCHFYSIFL